MVKDSWHSLVITLFFPVFVEMDRCKHDVLSVRTAAVPADLYESASIDGATQYGQLRYITIPLLKPTTIYVLTISIFGGMAMFSESYMLFNGNKSPNNVATTLVGMLYRMGFEQSQLGIASAIGVIFLLIVLAVNIVQLWINGTIGSKKGE